MSQYKLADVQEWLHVNQIWGLADTGEEHDLQEDEHTLNILCVKKAAMKAF